MADRKNTSRGQCVLLLIALAALLAGCGSPEMDGPHPVWPPPPAPPRVTHLKSVRGPSDLVKPNWLESIGGWIAGASGMSLARPTCVAVQEGQRIFISDQERQGVVVLELKSCRSSLIQRVGQTDLVSPVGLAVCEGRLAVADSALKSVFLLSAAGKLERAIEKPGGFGRPTGLAFDARRKLLYVVDTLANEVCAFDLPSGNMVSRFGQGGAEPGEFNFPTHIFLGPDGTIYVTDSLNFRVQAFDHGGKFLFALGKLGDASGHLAVPKGVGVDSFGHIYIVDSYFGTVQVFDRRGRFLLAIGEKGAGPGAFEIPTGLTVDSANRIYVCDSYNRRVQIFQYVGGPTDEDTSNNP